MLLRGYMKNCSLGINDFSPVMPVLGPTTGRGTSPNVRKKRSKHDSCKTYAIAAPSQAPSMRNGKGSIKFRTLNPAKEEERRKRGEEVFSEAGQWVDAMEDGLKDTGPREMAAILQEMGQHYNPRRLAAALEGKQLQTNTRALRITFTLGKFIAKIAKDYALGEMETKAAVRAKELRDLLGQLGPSFVKVGQALSSRPDLLPKVYLETLSALQDRLPPFPTNEAMAVIEEEVGPVSEIFSYITPEPIAAASLGQVYRGVLRSTGEEVAVKVQRPHISENIAIDMVLLRRFMTLVDSKLPSLVDFPIQPLVPLVDEFAEKLFSELNYMQEGRNAERFQTLYGKIPRVRVPKMKWGGLTSRRVLTMEFIHGCKLTDSVAMARNGLSIIDFVDVGIECSLRQLLAEDGGFFHADPHPGNLLAMRSGELCYLDFGMMSEAPQYARYAIISHVTHLVNRDYEAMCRDYYVLQFMDRSVDTQPIAPALAAFFDDVLDQSISQLNFKAIVDGLGGVLFKYPFRVPAYYALILRSLTVLEGLALQADPQYKLLKKAFPYIAQRVLTDDSPELRQSFRETVLDEEGRLRWGRLENLVEEGSKSLDYNPQQLWLLAQWVLGPQGQSIRKPLVEELARLMDAATAEEARKQVLRRTGNTELVERLVPVQPGDQQAAQRGRILFGTIFKDVSAEDVAIRGSGPFGIPLAQDIRRLTARLEVSLGRSWPQIQELLQVGGAVEARGMLMNALMSRATARFVKLMFGPTPKKNPQRQVAGGGSSVMITTDQAGVLPSMPVTSRSQI